MKVTIESALMHVSTSISLIDNAIADMENESKNDNWLSDMDDILSDLEKIESKIRDLLERRS